MDAADPIAAFFAAHGSTRPFGVGERLIHVGADPAGVFWLRSGAVKVILVGHSGRESVLEVREPGALVGEMSAILGGVRTAAVEGLVAGELWQVPTRSFAAALDDAAFCRAVLEQTARRLGQASVHQHEIAAGDARARVARVVSDLAHRIGTRKGKVISISALSQKEIADFAGVSRDGVVRAFTDFRRAGWVSTHRRSIEVLDLAALEARSQI